MDSAANMLLRQEEIHGASGIAQVSYHRQNGHGYVFQNILRFHVGVEGVCIPTQEHGNERMIRN